MGRSFKEYAKIHLFDKVCEEVEKFITDNFDELDIESTKLDDFSDFEILDYYQNNIYVDASFDEDNSVIYFVVEAEIVINQRDRHNDDYDTVNKWFIAICEGSLKDQFKSFSVVGVEEYCSKPQVKNGLSDYLTPYMYKEELDDIATEFLEKFYPEGLDQNKIVPINPKILANRLGLRILEHQISEHNSVFGSIAFEPCTIETYDSGDIQKIDIDGGTIIVDPTVFFLRNIGSVNNTIVHECVHWRYHKKGFELERLYNSNLSMLSCKVEGGITENSNDNLKWMEWQANALAPRIQMPISTFKIKIIEFVRNHLKTEKKQFIIDVIEPVIGDLADFFGVSKQAAKIRMIDAGYEEAKGALVYLNNNYVEPHYDEGYKLKSNEVYSLSYFDLALEYVRNTKLKELINTGAYIYVDSHVCLYNPLYVTHDLFGNYKLTEYAKRNMFECCLVFEITSNHLNISVSERYATECFLYRIINQDFDYQVRFTPNNQGAQNDSRKKYVEEVSKVIKDMPVGLGDALNYLIKLSEKSIEEIANLCCIDEKTIRRIKKEETNPDLRTLIAICIAMESPPPVTRNFIGKSNIRIVEYSEEGQALNLVIDSCRSIYDANMMLIALNQKPLTKKLE